MIRIAYSDVSDLDLVKGYELVTDSRKEKIDSFRFDKDKKLSCGVELLLVRLLADIGINDPVFSIDEYGKPYLSNYADVHFNMSHSGNHIACGISDYKIGLDIEYNDPEIDLDIAKHYFFKSEYVSIIHARKPSDEFFSYWVLKESYMKYTGLGMNLKLDAFEIVIDNEIRLKEDNENLKFNLFEIDDYKIGIASHYDVPHLIEYDIEEI